jgi:hypothetical protein
MASGPSNVGQAPAITWLGLVLALIAIRILYAMGARV